MEQSLEELMRKAAALKEQRAKYNEVAREKQNRAKTITCGCGATLREYCSSAHYVSQKHINWLILEKKKEAAAAPTPVPAPVEVPQSPSHKRTKEEAYANLKEQEAEGFKKILERKAAAQGVTVNELPGTALVSAQEQTKKTPTASEKKTERLKMAQQKHIAYINSLSLQQRAEYYAARAQKTAETRNYISHIKEDMTDEERRELTKQLMIQKALRVQAVATERNRRAYLKKKEKAAAAAAAATT